MLSSQNTPDVPAVNQGPGARSLPIPGSTFTEARYTGPFGSRRYKVFVPAGKHSSPLPLVVMLHGCTQSPVEFALGRE